MHILIKTCCHLAQPSSNPHSLSMQKTASISNLLLLLCLQTTAQAASTYSATLNCEAVQGGVGEPAFSAPLTLRVDGSTLSWSRESSAMREIISGTVTDGKADLDGYGGSVSAGTRQAFWEWKLAAQLQVTTQGVSGTAQLLSKDGRVVQRHCTVASIPAAMPAPSAATPPATVPQPVTGVAAAPSVQIAPPQAPAAAPAPRPPPPPEKVLSSADAEQTAAKEAEIRRREAALARREQSVAKRERSIAQQQAKSSPPSVQTPSQLTKPTSPPVPAQGPSKQLSVPTLGDICRKRYEQV